MYAGLHPQQPPTSRCPLVAGDAAEVDEFPPRDLDGFQVVGKGRLPGETMAGLGGAATRPVGRPAGSGWPIAFRGATAACGRVPVRSWRRPRGRRGYDDARALGGGMTVSALMDERAKAHGGDDGKPSSGGAFQGHLHFREMKEGLEDQEVDPASASSRIVRRYDRGPWIGLRCLRVRSTACGRHSRRRGPADRRLRAPGARRRC